MNGGRIVLVVCVAWGLLLAAGCSEGDGGAKVPPEFAARIDVIGASLMRGGRGFPHLEGFAETDRLFDAIPEGAGRRAAALAFSDMLLALDLGGILPYPSREFSVSLYRKYLYQALELMNKSGVAPGMVMDRYFEGFSKYRDACLGVPSDGQRAGESRRDFIGRYSCACNLRDDYKLALSIFRRFWLPDLSQCFPPEYHDEFRRRLKAFEQSEPSRLPRTLPRRATSEP